jgi:hypothetical protein
MRTWPPSLLLLFGFLVLVAAGIPVIEVDSPTRLYNEIDALHLWNDEPTRLLPAGVRYAIYWLSSAAAIVGLSLLLTWLVRIVLWRVPSVMWTVAGRYDRAKQLAIVLSEDHHLARSRIAVRDPRGEGLSRREGRPTRTGDPPAARDADADDPLVRVARARV